MKQSILLTGCAGFIGSNLLDKLLAGGHKAIGVDDFNDYYSPSQKRANIAHNLKHQNFKLISVDISSLDLHQRINALTPSFTSQLEPESALQLKNLFFMKK